MKASDAMDAAASADRRRGYEFRPVGFVSSPLQDVASAPKQADEGAPEAWLVFDEGMREALADVRAGDDAILLTWLDRARRDVLSVHPRDQASRPRTGVFATRSADRPNPIGLHRIEIIHIEGVRLRVRQLEALDQTPILDLKPVLGGEVRLR